MAELVRIEPALFREDEAWFIFSDGRKCLRKTTPRPERRTAPAILRDGIDPTWGADGRLYDSLSALRRTYRPDGNPRGEWFHELGSTEELKPQTYEFDRAQRRDDIKAAIQDVKYGRVPPIPPGPEDVT